MALANIVVHLDSGSRTAERLALATTLARRHGARLTGLFAEVTPAHRVGVVSSWPPAEHVAAVAAARAAFEAATSDLTARVRFVDVNRGGEQEILSRTTDIVRAFDLVILGQSVEESRTPQDLPEQIILESGRPVLVLPHAGSYPDIGHRPIFAWHRSRGAARALHDALPLILPGADGLVVEAGGPGHASDEFEELVVADLSAHGVSARFQNAVVEEVRLMDTLLNQAADHSADLMAIGAFDGAGFAFFGRGSGTRYMLRHMTLPVLFSH